MRTIYFDYNATTPLDPAVREAMLPYLDKVWGNPSSVHRIGREARALLDDARDRVAQVWRAKPSEVVFTGGGTESNNLAIFGTARLLRAKGRHLITSQIEHHAALHCFQYLEKKEGFEVTYLPVSAEGVVSPDDLRKALRPDTVLVSIMAANNETGVIQPVAELGALCRERGVVFHTDAVQWFGKLPFETIHQFNADLVSICAHKFHGPKGAGALFIRSPLQPDPILFGGGHENERRAGTENLPAIIGLTEATERFVREPVFPAEQLGAWTRELAEAAAAISGVTMRGTPLTRPSTTLSPSDGERDGVRGSFVADPSKAKSASSLPVDGSAQTTGTGKMPVLPSRLSNTLAFTVDGSDSIVLMAVLDMDGICASSGSACSAGSLEPSHVMLAMGASPAQANSLVRFSLGRETTDTEVRFVREALPRLLAQVRG
jgi:cysteine desulfurase